MNQLQTHVAEVGALEELLPEAVKSVGSVAAAGRKLYDESAPIEIAQALYQLAIAIGSSLIWVV